MLQDGFGSRGPRARAILCALALSLAGCFSLVDVELTEVDANTVRRKVTLFNIHLDQGAPIRVFEYRTPPQERMGLLQVWQGAEKRDPEQVYDFTPGSQSPDDFFKLAQDRLTQAQDIYGSFNEHPVIQQLFPGGLPPLGPLVPDDPAPPPARRPPAEPTPRPRGNGTDSPGDDLPIDPGGGGAGRD